MKVLLLMMFAGMLPVAYGGPVTWYLHGLHYAGLDNAPIPGQPSYAGWASGWFTYDADSGQVIDWLISDGPGPEVPFVAGDGGSPFFNTNVYPTEFTWSGSNGTGTGTSDPTRVDFFAPDNRYFNFPIPLNYLSLVFDVPLSNAGIQTGITPSAGIFSAGSEAIRNRVTGGLTARLVLPGAFVSTEGPSTTPEPSTISVLFVTVLCAGVVRLKRNACRKNLQSRTHSSVTVAATRTAST